VAFPGLWVAGDVTNWYQSLSSNTEPGWARKGSVEVNIHRRLISKWTNFKSQSVHGKFWHRAENVGVQVCAVNCGVTHGRILCADARAKISIAWCAHT
jgi:hypothetical protein